MISMYQSKSGNSIAQNHLRSRRDGRLITKKFFGTSDFLPVEFV